MLTWESIQKVFDSGKRPYWFLYKGNGKGSLIGSNTDMENLVESWEILAELIETYGPGVYTVELRTSPHANRGQPMHTFSYGDVSDTPRVSGTGGQAAQHRPETRFMAGIDAKYLLEQQAQFNASLMQLQLEKLKLEMAIERMKEQQEAENKPDGIGRIFGVIEKNPSIAERLISGIFGGQPTAIGVLKAARNEVVEEDEDEYEDDDEAPETPEAAGVLSIDQAVTALYRLKKALPDLDVNALLFRIAKKAEKEPAIIRAALQYI